MALIPFVLVLESSLAGNGTGTVSYPVPAGEMLELQDMVFSATGAFNITGIRDSSGRHYTNASLTTEIPSTTLKSGANNNNAISPFVIPLIIDGSVTFYIDLEDSSGGANTVTLVFSGKRNTSG